MNLDDIEAFLKGTDVASEQKRMQVVRAIGQHSVGLFAVRGSDDGDHLSLAGSGTLVQIGGAHHILTARHVWEEVLKISERLGVTLVEGVDHWHLINVKAVVPLGPTPVLPWTDKGPDFVLLRVPHEYVVGIESFKSFYNLSAEDPAPPPGNLLQTWFLMGVPGCTGVFTQIHASVEHIGAEVGLLSTFEHGSFDLCDVNFNASGFPGPKSLGGISGGGLWKVYLHDAPTPNGFDCAVILSGVAFWQFPLDGSNRRVRCHGPKTIKKIVSLAGAEGFPTHSYSQSESS
jgi:hypothetical protein